jgi:predicted transcriptional regulator YdeE
MQTQIQTAPINIVGLELRTTNQEASSEIPALWKRFMTQGIFDRIPNKISSDVYAIYTNFEHEGVDNTGVYSCVIGAAVSNLDDMPSDLIAVSLPASTYQVIPVPDNRADLVGETWQKIWQEDASQRTFLADFERYQTNGTISIWLGIR